MITRKTAEMMKNFLNKDGQWLLVVLLMLLTIIAFGWYSLVTGKDLRSIESVLLLLTVRLGTLLDFRWGSSRSSQEKTELLNKKKQEEGA